MLLFNNTGIIGARENLALEEALFTVKPPDEDLFMLWQNQNAVIIGRNQITYNEVNLDFAGSRNVEIVRRLSGGGAVYHDLGNLNFTFITDYKKHIKIDFYKPLLDTLKQLGINAVRSGRNDVYADGYKISGNSVYINKGKLLHHGTVLFSSDLDFIEKVLTPEEEKLRDKGVSSVRAHVSNISDLLKKPLNIEEFRQLFIHSVKKEFSSRDFMPDSSVLELKDFLFSNRYNTLEWNYSRELKNGYKIVKRFKSGTVTLQLLLKNFKIKRIVISGDFFSIKNIKSLERLLQGRSIDGLKEILKQIKIDDYIIGLDNESFLELFRGINGFEC